MFEFDPAKSEANRAKHGIDFVEAQALWLDDGRLTFRSVNVTEERWIMVGRIGDLLWTAVVTYRADAVRIISVRRARRSEVKVYERQTD